MVDMHSSKGAQSSCKKVLIGLCCPEPMLSSPGAAAATDWVGRRSKVLRG